MSTAMKVLVACLAFFGFVFLGFMLIGLVATIFHWLVVAALVIGVGYAVYAIASHDRTPALPSQTELDQHIKKLHAHINSTDELSKDKVGRKK